MNTLFHAPYEIPITIIIFLIGAFILNIIRKPFGISLHMASFLYLWHTLFCLLYFSYSLYNPADSNGYYAASLQKDINFNWGTSFVIWLVYHLINFGLSYLNCFFIFNIIGTIGLLAFCATLLSISQKNRFHNLIIFIVFLPSVSFWSSAIGKDSIAFMSINLFLWASVRKSEINYFIMAFSIIIMSLVRPHVGGMMLIALACSLLLSFSTRKTLLAIPCLFIIAISIPALTEYAGLTSESSSYTIGEYIDIRQGYNLSGNSSIDISQLSFPIQLFTYLFRPMPGDMADLLGVSVSIENTILLILILIMALNIRIYKPSAIRRFSDSRVTLLSTYILLTLTIFAMMTTNMGIAIRQKWMIFPAIICLLMLLAKPTEKRLPISQLKH